MLEWEDSELYKTLFEFCTSAMWQYKRCNIVKILILNNFSKMHSIWADILTHFQEVTGEKLDMNSQQIKNYSFNLRQS